MEKWSRRRPTKLSWNVCNALQWKAVVATFSFATSLMILGTYNNNHEEHRKRTFHAKPLELELEE